MKHLIVALLLALSLPFNAFADGGVSDTSSESLNTYININQDDAEKMATILVGVGPAIAERIIAYRQLNGPFITIDDLLNVKGFGAKKLESNKAFLKL